MIEVKNIRKSFNGKTVIEDVSCVMKSGQCNLIIGSSGSGKTVFMKCLVGLFTPDSGEILYGGESFTQMNVDQKRNAFPGLGIVQQFNCGRQYHFSFRHVY